MADTTALPDLPALRFDVDPVTGSRDAYDELVERQRICMQRRALAADPETAAEALRRHARLQALYLTRRATGEWLVHQPAEGSRLARQAADILLNTGAPSLADTVCRAADSMEAEARADDDADGLDADDLERVRQQQATA